LQKELPIGQRFCTQKTDFLFYFFPCTRKEHELSAETGQNVDNIIYKAMKVHELWKGKRFSLNKTRASKSDSRSQILIAKTFSFSLLLSIYICTDSHISYHLNGKNCRDCMVPFECKFLERIKTECLLRCCWPAVYSIMIIIIVDI